jgi:hypothetical protein
MVEGAGLKCLSANIPSIWAFMVCIVVESGIMSSSSMRGDRATSPERLFRHSRQVEMEWVFWEIKDCRQKNRRQSFMADAAAYGT